MLLQEIKEIKSGRKERHQFALVIAGAAVALGLYLDWRVGFYPLPFIVAIVLLIPVGIDKCFKTDTAIILLPLQRIWMGVAIILGHFVSRIILGLFFFGVFTIVRLLNRFFGKPLLDTAWDKTARESYWIPRNPDDYTPDHSERQF